MKNMKQPVEKDVMKAVKAKVEALQVAYKEHKNVTPAMIEELKALRELFKDIEKPTVVKSIRLVYEHIEMHGSLDNLKYWEEEEIELDDENSSFAYYIGLLINPTNKYNREEIKELNVLLKTFGQEEEE
ncbi:MAG: hypothetical protein AB8E82_20150 [Aureispira sp.]